MIESNSVMVPRSLPKTLLILFISIYGYWGFMVTKLAMNPMFILFPLCMTVVFGYVVLKSYYRNQADYGFYLFFIFLILGFIINTAVVDANRAEYVWGTWKSIGRFDFSDNQYLLFWVIVSVGFLGVIFGTRMAKRLSALTFKNISLHSNFVHKNIGFSLILWFVLGIVIQLVMWKYSIGMHTVKTTIDLPFKLNGAMVFYRDAMHILILGYILSHIGRRRGLKKRYLLLIAIEALVATMTSLSKSAIVFRFAPIILFYFINRRISIKRFFFIFVLMIPVLSLLVLGMNVIRISNISGNDSIVIAKDLFDVFDPLKFIGLAMDRVTGAPELMAIVSYTNHSYETLMNFWSGSMGDHNIVFYGLDLGDKMGSKGLTFFGVWYLSGSFALVFVASTVISFVVTLFEKLWQSKGLYFLSCFSSVLLAFSLYARGGNRAFYSIIMCIVFYYFIVLMKKMRTKKRIAG